MLGWFGHPNIFLFFFQKNKKNKKCDGDTLEKKFQSSRIATI